MAGGGVSVRETPMWYEPWLDVLRFFAFLCVFTSHNLDVSTFAPAWLRARVGWGATFGVLLFFVLSAFLLTRLMQFEFTRSGRIDIVHYFRRRIRRIWPLYFLFLAAAVAALVTLSAVPRLATAIGAAPHNVLTYEEIPGYAFFVANWSVPRSNFLPHLWSLSVEEQFYLVLPVLYLTARRRSHVLWAIAIGGSAITVLLVALDVAPRRVGTATTTYAISFVAGVLLACKENESRACLANRTRRRRLVTFTLCASLMFFGFLPALADLLGDWGPTVFVPVMTGISLASIILLLATRHPLGGVGRTFGWLGKRGYGLYVFHWPILQLLVQLPVVSEGGRITALGVTVSLVATIAVSLLSYRLFEVRFLDWRREARTA